MNSLIEILNAGGDHAVRFAWPMLWQSSLLIGLLFALEWVWRRKVRAAVRYALWLVVLAKLLLPPSLALPTGLGWWLRLVPAAPKAQASPVVVTYGPELALNLPADNPAVSMPPAHASLSAAGVGLIGSSLISLGLLVWMLLRWREVALEAHTAGAAPEWLEALLEESRRTAQVRCRVRLRLIDKPASPAVCGLLRPTILLPRPLSEQLPPAQLRAVLLHELVHLRRGDVWVNCAQALLQLVYWWHPLLWLANARIRRVREEAVDDAVVQALGGEAEGYAPTLLEVAKLALQRPLASLGLVGILESHNSLRQRIVRLLDLRPPRKAGLTLGSALWVLAFGALAVPMGEWPAAPAAGPDKATKESRLNPAGNPVVTNTPARQAQAPALFDRTIKVDLNTFLAGVRARAGLAETADGQAIAKAMGDIFANAGVDFAPPKSFFLTDSIGALIVRATRQDLDIIERTVRELSLAPPAAPPQIAIAAKFIEIPEESVADFWQSLGVATSGPANSARTLKPAQTAAALKKVNSTPGCQIAQQMAVTTLSGRQAEIQTVELMSIVTNINPQALKPPGLSTRMSETGGLYLTRQIGLGPTLNLVPYVVSNGWAVQLTMIPTLTEFLGYDKPSNSIPVYVNGKKQAATLPTPRLRICSLTNSATVWDGHTLVLDGLVAENIVKLKDEVPLLGDLPLVGKLFRSESTTVQKKRLLVFITPTLVDPAGNRVHREDEVPPAE